MQFIDLLNLRYHVVNGVALSGEFNPDEVSIAKRATDIDHLLTNARNLLLALDASMYLIHDLMESIQSNEVNNNKMLTDRAKAFIDVARLSISAALGQELPSLMYPYEAYNEFGIHSDDTPVGTENSSIGLDNAIVQLQDMSVAMKIAASNGSPAEDTIKRLSKSDTAKSKAEPVQHEDNVVHVITSRWKSPRRKFSDVLA
jgi:hypothetical protein